jgi:hypothetical protein
MLSIVTSYFGFLLKYGPPLKLMDVVKCMYKECKVEVKVGKEERGIDYITGVQK